MAQGRKYETERYYDEDRKPSGNGPAWVMAAVMVCAGLVFGAWLLVDMYPKGITLADPSGAVGGQAPPSRRGTNRGSDTRVSTPPEAAINNYNATAQAQYDAALAAGEQGATLVLQVATPPPRPLNSQGEPVINQEQANQQRLALQLAEQEGADAVDQQLAAARDAANAEALARPPDVSKADAEKMMGRDLCSVPRANPVTCGQGLYKPTPVQ